MGANFADRGCLVVSVTDSHGSILGFLDRIVSQIGTLKYALKTNNCLPPIYRTPSDPDPKLELNKYEPVYCFQPLTDPK
jgi:hypothetical protein